MSSEADDHGSSSAEAFRTFCPYPFFHINIKVDGKASLCCRACATFAVNGRELSLHHDTFNDMWNSSYIQDVRRRMVSGQPVAACVGCYQAEKQSGKSLRGNACNANFAWPPGMKSLREVFEYSKAIVTENGAVAPPPSSLHLWLGNACNLKCRMCSPRYSSLVAGDPFHSLLSNDNGPLERTITLLPDFLARVSYQGFAELETRGVDYRLLAPQRTALISLASTGDPIERIVLTGFKDGAEPCTLVVAVGTDRVIRRPLDGPDWRVEAVFEPPVECLSEISVVLRLEGEPSKIGIRNLTLTSAQTPGKAFPKEFASRLIENPNWFQSEDVLMNEILGNLETIRVLNFAGGEPMLNRNIVRILQSLVEKGLSKKIVIQFSTNGTVKTPQISALLREFSHIGLAVSIDGMGKLQEYIRPPAKWASVIDNVLRYRDEGLEHVSIRPLAQVYNLFGLLDLVEFCDKNNLEVKLGGVLYYPVHLSFDILPQALIDEALAEYKRYRDDGRRPHLAQEVGTIIGALERPRPANRVALQEKFIRFTSELDKARKESLKSASPRLYERLITHGFVF